ncbi:hypothetical protein TBLA_0F00730 [Henningerozyma blattae CBS 6284]|uniref:Uncharacterized protein n=1 Tax=Henningerozyma blattae (strain ATCC 34711 / CBS 6284 / DSM 70876 / NBRC 10599 / NRRL Y-10934 / UCD 77-7) TaxID=1071380 RepID=I2H5G6_HENB6|nr:hypothetical protein TBLA_0F00730 [Tetrapisispora blattae CBS 6284]CCH61618.1 hypothetical protein TBLA_0F00730 [Tetrapisispora blattae CBS 6284]
MSTAAVGSSSKAAAKTTTPGFTNEKSLYNPDGTLKKKSNKKSSEKSKKTTEVPVKGHLHTPHNKPLSQNQYYQGTQENTTTSTSQTQERIRIQGQTAYYEQPPPQYYAAQGPQAIPQMGTPQAHAAGQPIYVQQPPLEKKNQECMMGFLTALCVFLGIFLLFI